MIKLMLEQHAIPEWTDGRATGAPRRRAVVMAIDERHLHDRDVLHHAVDSLVKELTGEWPR